jgi:outer membrane usher protein
MVKLIMTGFSPWLPSLAAIAALAMSGNSAAASLHFDRSMIAGDAEAVADLTIFEDGGKQLPGAYDVDIVLNGKKLGRRTLRFVPNKKPEELSPNVSIAKDETGLVPCFSLEELAGFGIDVHAFPEILHGAEGQCISPDFYIPHANTAFDFQKMQLDISIPQAAMINYPHGWIPTELWDEGISAALMSWQLSGSENHGSYGDSRSQFLNLTSGFNFGSWRLRDNSTWANTENQFNHRQRWQHLNTLAQRAIIPWRSELTLGDGLAESEVFDTVPFRGMGLATDDGMYPDTQQGFAPTIRGTAESNAQVTIQQAGHVVYRTFVAPGAFELNDLFPVSSGGDLTVTITEADGRVHGFTVPYSSVPVLQREGHVRYSLAAGRYRNSGDAYDAPLFAQGAMQWGLPDDITLYGGGQLSENYRAFALGAGMNMGAWGAFSADIIQANSTLADGSRHEGQSARFLYGRSLLSLGTTFQLAGYRFSTQGFHTLDEAALQRMSGWTDDSVLVDATGRPLKPNWNNYYNLYSNKRDRLQASISQRLGTLGSVYLTGYRQSFWDDTAATTSLQAGFSSSFSLVNYSLSYGYSRYGGQPQAERSLYLSMSAPLLSLMPDRTQNIRSTWLTYSMSQQGDGSVIQQAGVSGTSLERNNLNWSVAQGEARGSGASGDANLAYRGAYGNASAGYGYGKLYRQIRYGLSGSAVLHGQGLTFGQPLGVTNVLVAAPGASDIAIENGTGVSTDWRGYAIVPYASMYRENRVALDVSQLDRHTEVDSAASKVVPTRGALVLANFHARTGMRALLTLSHRGKPLPFGTLVSNPEGTNSGLTGEGGQVFLSGLKAQGTLKAQWGEGEYRRCNVHYILPAEEDYPVVRAGAECH